MGKSSKLKTPVSYYGGKQLMARYIIPNIPEHKTYVEPFCGGAAIFFAKEKSEVEIINDTDKELMNFYDVLQNDFVALEKEIKISLHSRDLHRKAWTIYSNPDMFNKVKRAWAIWILSSQGFGGMLSSSWGRDKTQNKSAKSVRNKRNDFSEEYAIRMQDVTLESRDAIKVIKSTDYKEAFFYCDPPYYNADMGHYDGYTIDDFELLLKTLSEIEGKFMLSSYPSELLNKYTKKNKWYQFSVDKAVPISNKGKRKTEVLTANYNISNPFK